MCCLLPLHAAQQHCTVGGRSPRQLPRLLALALVAVAWWQQLACQIRGLLAMYQLPYQITAGATAKPPLLHPACLAPLQDSVEVLKGAFIGGFPAARLGLAAGEYQPEQFKVLTRYSGERLPALSVLSGLLRGCLCWLPAAQAGASLLGTRSYGCPACELACHESVKYPLG